MKNIIITILLISTSIIASAQNQKATSQPVDGELVLSLFRNLQFQSYKDSVNPDQIHYSIVNEEILNSIGNEGVTSEETNGTLSNDELMMIAYIAIKQLELRNEQFMTSQDMLNEVKAEFETEKEQTKMLTNEVNNLRDMLVNLENMVMKFENRIINMENK